MRELKRLQTFGRLASKQPAEGQVYVDAPHAWREVAGGDGTRGGCERIAMAGGAERADDDSAASGANPAVGCMSAPIVTLSTS